MKKIINKRALLYIAIVLIFNTLFSQNETKEITLVFYRKIALSPLRIPFFTEKEEFSFKYQSDTVYCFFKDKPDTIKARDGVVILNYIRQTVPKYKTHSVKAFTSVNQEIKEFVLYSDERIYYFKQNIKDKDIFDLYKMDKQ